MSNRLKGMLIIIALFIIIVLPVCYALYREHNLKQTEINTKKP
jgi:hypothetical protein